MLRAALLLIAQASAPAIAPPETDKAAAMAVVEALLAAVSARDEAAGLAQIRPSGTATSLMEQADGSVTVRNFPLRAFAEATPGPERYDERMIDPVVEVHGAIATVSGRYTFAIDGKIGHCGDQHFDLVRDAGAWKVQNVTWSIRTMGCVG